MQTSLTSVIMAIIGRLEKEIAPQADRIMQLMLTLLQSLPPKSSVPDTVFATIGSLANVLDADFEKYMQSFAPFLLTALNNQEEPQLCSMAIGLVTDVTRALEQKIAPWCDGFMNGLLNNLRVCESPVIKSLRILTFHRAQTLATSSSQRFCSHLAILLNASVVPSSLIFPLSRKSCSRLPTSITSTAQRALR
jgi:hypothetical protein